MFPWCILRNIIQAENFRDKLLKQCTIRQALKSCHCQCRWFEWLITHTQRINLTPPTLFFFFFPCKIYNKSKREGLRHAAAGSFLSAEAEGKRSRGGARLPSFSGWCWKNKANPLGPPWHLCCHNPGSFPTVLSNHSITSFVIVHLKYMLYCFLDRPGYTH